MLFDRGTGGNTTAFKTTQLHLRWPGPIPNTSTGEDGPSGSVPRQPCTQRTAAASMQPLILAFDMLNPNQKMAFDMAKSTDIHPSEIVTL